MPLEKKKFLTTAEAGEILGISADGVKRLIQRKLIAAEKFGRAYAIAASEVKRYQTQRRQPGNPNFAPSG